MSVITKIGTASPQFKHSQKDILEFMLSKTSFNKEEQRMLKLMYHMSGISHRYSVLPDFSIENGTALLFDQNQNNSVTHRLNIYDQEATKLAVAAIKDSGVDKEKITHLITVSCTGMSAPGLDVMLVKELGLSTSLERTSINFMGCYAAIHGMKAADHIVRANPDAYVLVVCVELCTLHFQADNTIDYITSNLLFGDGAACFLVENEGSGLGINSFFSKIYLEAEESMAWHISEHGFLMSLKSEVPALIQDNIAAFVAESGFTNIDKWIIHPGGRKILEASAKALSLKADDLKESFDILKDFGNMSSVTLVFILKQVIQTEFKNAFVAGFGPGITMESVSLSKI